MNLYEEKALIELRAWQIKMTRQPSFLSGMAKGIQRKMNELIPEKIHRVLTTAIKNMVHATLVGSQFTTGSLVPEGMGLDEREKLVEDKLGFYKKAAAAEGAGTGAGGFFLGLADFPLLLTLKIKFLFETANLYGYDVRDIKERIFILYLFQLAFSSSKRRREVYYDILHWEKTIKKYPLDTKLASFDWRQFQQEYRDHIDLIKLFQLLPGIGAAVGAYANYTLLDSLGETAKNGYRLRHFKDKSIM
ncbi:conserved hypothetical protein [Desulforamulus reducens MI-1]|uniref:EcsC family protein n=1 Tax=Desulforamulus reducens (strain ATCC BAA-1160 / DSM 100696 / MI-1) TaxID=349161 RepID=A4J6B0_DESRM|nr:EcsC family protein [Desulforamulus reducens]ABO50613.1 conserved hypothetical protein [Desulforamulus reducens MI-1]